MKMVLIMLVGAMIVGCAPMTQGAIDRKDDLEYYQVVREESFRGYKQECERAGGYVYLERMGRSTRRQEITNMPGRGDKVSCIGR